jgi:hypothetical protein
MLGHKLREAPGLTAIIEPDQLCAARAARAMKSSGEPGASRSTFRCTSSVQLASCVSLTSVGGCTFSMTIETGPYRRMAENSFDLCPGMGR